MTVLADLVGEGKKYANADELAKAYSTADGFIEQLKGETAQLREQLTQALESSNRSEALEKLMAELKNNNGNRNDPPNPPTETQADQPKTLSQDDIVRIIEAREAEKAAERNLNTAMEKIKKVYGDKTDEFFAQKAQSLGLTVDQLKALGRSSSDALTNVLGIVGRDSSTKSMATGSHATIPVGTSEVVRNKAYYDKLQKEMGATKFILDRSLQIQLMKDFNRLGDAWDT